MINLNMKLIALLCLFSAYAVLSCPFAGLAKHNPHLLDDYVTPGALINDAAGTAMNSGSLGVTSTSSTKLSRMISLAKSMNKDLCYWSMQTLPAPPKEDGTFPAFLNLTDSRLGEQLGEEANSRWQAQVAPGGNVVWGGCAIGWRVRQTLCQANSSSPKCTLALRNQSIPWPTASVIIKISATTGSAVNRTVWNWRKDQTGHIPAMESTLVTEKWWGYGGKITAKLVLCDTIPARFKYPAPFECDTMGQSKPLMDEAVDTWKSLCNVWKDDLYSPTGTGTSCPGISNGAVGAQSSLSILSVIACISLVFISRHI